MSETRARGIAALPPVALRALREFGGSWRRLVRDRPIGINVDGDPAEAILREGRFRTMFETYGPAGRGARPGVEERLFGLPQDADPVARPVYGALRTGREDEVHGTVRSSRPPREVASDYGDHLFLLRPEAKERSSYTLGDSFGIGSMARPGRQGVYRFDEGPAPLDEALGLNRADFAGGGPEMVGGYLGAVQSQAQRRYGLARGQVGLSPLDVSFVETQTPGPVTLDEVSALIIPGSEGGRFASAVERADRIAGLAAERGAPVFEGRALAADHDLQRALGLRAAAGAAGAGAASEGLADA